MEGKFNATNSQLLDRLMSKDLPEYVQSELTREMYTNPPSFAGSQEEFAERLVGV